MSTELEQQVINLRSYVGSLEILLIEIFSVLEKRDVVFREFCKKFLAFDDLSQFETFDDEELKQNRVFFEQTRKQLELVLSKPAPS